MKTFLVAWSVFLLPAMGLACDICGIYLGIQPRDRTSSFSMLYRFRHLEGDVMLPLSKSLAPKHGGHASDGIPMSGDDHYRELYQVMEFRADIWLGQRFALLASLPVSNSYRAVNGYITSDVTGVGDPLAIARYLVANTKGVDNGDRTVHRLMVGVGVKAPLGQSDMQYRGEPVDLDLQPGTGSWDMLATTEYMVRRGRNGASATFIGRYNGANKDGYQLGHGISATTELFRRWDLSPGCQLMPSVGVYAELTSLDVENDVTVAGTGGATLFGHAAARLWWRAWSLSATFQYAMARDQGYLMVPDRERVVAGITYNLIKT